jgi:hypothetical protein
LSISSDADAMNFESRGDVVAMVMENSIPLSVLIIPKKSPNTPNPHIRAIQKSHEIILVCISPDHSPE